MEQVNTKDFFTGRADDLPKDKVYKLAKCQDFARGLGRHLIKLSTLTVPVPRFVKQNAENGVSSETRFRQDVIMEIPVKEKTSPLSPLTGRSLNSSKISKEDKNDKKKDKRSLHHHS